MGLRVAWLILLLVLLGAILVLYSCGGGGGDKSTPPTAREASLQATVQAQATLIAMQATTIAQLRGGQGEQLKAVGTPTPEAAASGEVYVVQAGDTLNAIAQRLGVTVDALVKANNITNPNSLSIGQTLTIPPKQ